MTGLNAVVNKRIRARPKESRPSPEAQCGLLPCPLTTLPPASHSQGDAQNQGEQREQTQRGCLSTSERQRRRGRCRRNGGLPYRSRAQLEGLSLIHISEPTRRTPISYAAF